LEPCHVAELGGAHRREVLGMREQHAPGVADPVVKPDRAFGGVRLEVRCEVADLESHPQSSAERGRDASRTIGRSRAAAIRAAQRQSSACRFSAREPHYPKIAGNSVEVGRAGAMPTIQKLQACSAPVLWTGAILV